MSVQVCRLCVLTCSDSWVVVRQQKPLHPVLHVLQDPAVSQLITRSLDGQPVQTLRRVILDHLTDRDQTLRSVMQRQVLNIDTKLSRNALFQRRFENVKEWWDCVWTDLPPRSSAGCRTQTRAFLEGQQQTPSASSAAWRTDSPPVRHTQNVT